MDEQDILAQEVAIEMPLIEFVKHTRDRTARYHQKYISKIIKIVWVEIWVHSLYF